MSDKQNRANITAEYIAGLVRKRALASIDEHDRELSKTYDAIAAGIRKDLRAVGYSVAQVRAILDKHFGATAEQRGKIIEKAIVGAAREARTLDKETFEAVFGADEVAAAPVPFAPSSPPTPTRSLRLVSESEDEPQSTD